MAEYNGPSCVAEVGLLVLRKCGKPAEGRCAMCGLPFCKKHLIPVEKGVMCPNCAEKSGAAVQGGQQSKWQDLVARQRRRHRYYRDYDYYPYYYHDYGYYSYDDYASVRSSGEEKGQDGEGAEMTDSFGSDYDFTES